MNVIAFGLKPSENWKFLLYYISNIADLFFQNIFSCWPKNYYLACDISNKRAFEEHLKYDIYIFVLIVKPEGY